MTQKPRASRAGTAALARIKSATAIVDVFPVEPGGDLRGRRGGRNNVDCADACRMWTVVDDDIPRARLALRNGDLCGQQCIGGFYAFGARVGFARPFEVKLGYPCEIAADNRQRLAIPRRGNGVGGDRGSDRPGRSAPEHRRAGAGDGRGAEIETRNCRHQRAKHHDELLGDVVTGPVQLTERYRVFQFGSGRRRCLSQLIEYQRVGEKPVDFLLTRTYLKIV